MLRSINAKLAPTLLGTIRFMSANEASSAAQR
jgi:hypothetical protein